MINCRLFSANLRWRRKSFCVWLAAEGRPRWRQIPLRPLVCCSPTAALDRSWWMSTEWTTDRVEASEILLNGNWRLRSLILVISKVAQHTSGSSGRRMLWLHYRLMIWKQLLHVMVAGHETGPFGCQRTRSGSGFAEDAVDGRNGRHLARIAKPLAEQSFADLRRKQRRPFAL